MTTYIHTPTVEGDPSTESLAVVAAVAGLGVDPVAVVVGPLSDDGRCRLVRHGCRTAIHVDDGSSLTAPSLTELVHLLIGGAEGGTWLAPTATDTTEAAGLAAARTGAGLLWRLVGLERDGDAIVARQVSADGTTVRAARWNTPARIGLIRPHAFEAVEVDPDATADLLDVEPMSAPPPDGRVATVVDRRPTASAGAALARADVVVAGGRGLGSPERLDLVRELAEVLGGTPGVSLPLVEAGWAPRSMQVGQTGTVVAPRLYVACGISGQIQHRVGMERSGAIVAINTDPGAPIMSFCDLAVVADAAAVLPGLIDALRAAT